MLEAHTDYVSDLCLHEPEACLLSVSGDGTLAVLDVRRMKVRRACLRRSAAQRARPAALQPPLAGWPASVPEVLASIPTSMRCR